MSIGDRIKFVRNRLSQTEFADLLGVHRNTLQRWETNIADPPGQILIRFIDLFNVNVNWLLSGKGEPFLSNPERRGDQAAESIEPPK